MHSAATDVLVVIIGALVAAALAGVGWMLRRFVSSLDGMREDVRELSDLSVADRAVGPERASRLQDVEDVVEEHTTQLAVLHAWQLAHDQHHDRHRSA